MSAEHPIMLGLPRPEYIAAPEVLISSLAWQVFADAGAGETQKPIALAYRTDNRTSRTLEFLSTEPQGDRLIVWGDHLRDAGIRTVDDSATGAMARAIASSIAGVRASRAKGQAATPLTPNLALLQNTRGMMGKRNPPDVGRIIERLYALGCEGEVHETASERWHEAALAQTARDSLLSAIDVAVRETLLPMRPTRREVSGRMFGSRQILGTATPFAWFADAWNRLTSTEWVDALPARRWVDWATTVLRAAIAFGYLWEARYFEELARSVVEVSGTADAESLNIESVCGRVRLLVPWVSRDEAISVRDVSSRLKSSVRRGAHCEAVFRSWCGERELEDTAFADVIADMCSDGDLVVSLQGALASGSEAGGNTWEAIRYSLLTRERYGPYADYYGLLATRGTRYLLVDPGTEWIAVMTSLAASGPGSSSTIGAVRRSLRRLGLNPDVQELVTLLESAGLARGSADADEAVIVQSAY